MSPAEIADILKATFGEAIVSVAVEGGHPSITIDATRWHDVALFLRDDPRLRLNLLRCISGVDWPKENALEVVYDLMAIGSPQRAGGLFTGGNVIAFKVRVPREDGHVPSVVDIWPAADWHEREAFDLLGVVFDGHPDPRRILCPDDWVGHPLRKDYQFPEEYHGIPGNLPAVPAPAPVPGVPEYGLQHDGHR